VELAGEEESAYCQWTPAELNLPTKVEYQNFFRHAHYQVIIVLV
jgi:hypothetical protein